MFPMNAIQQSEFGSMNQLVLQVMASLGIPYRPPPAGQVGGSSPGMGDPSGLAPECRRESGGQQDSAPTGDNGTRARSS